MANSQMSRVANQLIRTVLAGAESELTDGQLLECFLSHREEAAVAALLRRHGPMVWGVCRRILGNHHDAEDAFQATFLVFVRKADSVVPREMVAHWLYGVAYQTALKARQMAAKRKAREKQLSSMPEPEAKPQVWDDLRPFLDQELRRLPGKYRAAIILSDLEGKSRKEAARQLHIPEGTLSSRLTTGRRMLAKRLARHGLPASGGALAVVLAQDVSACVPSGVMAATIRVLTLLANGQAAAAGVISANVVTLTQGVIRAMLWNRFKTATLVLLIPLLVVASGLSIAAAVSDDKNQQAPPAAVQEAETVQTNPRALSAAYNRNEAFADEQFTGRQVVVAGSLDRICRVQGVGRASGKDVYMLIMPRVAGPDWASVWFQFDAKDRPKLAALKPDEDDLTVRGRCKGKTVMSADGNRKAVILIEECTIVDIKKRPPLPHLPSLPLDKGKKDKK